MLRKKLREGITVIGRGSYVEGTLRSLSNLHVDGTVVGKIEAGGRVAIGPEGMVDGDLEGGDVVIAGRVEGKVIAQKNLHLLSSALITGDIFYKTLQVDSGGSISGRTNRLGEMAETITADLPEPITTPALGGA